MINNFLQYVCLPVRNQKALVAFLCIALAVCHLCVAQSQKDIDSLLIKSENLVYTEPAKAGVLNDFIFKEAKSLSTRTAALLFQAEALETQLKYYEALQKIIEAKDFNAGHDNAWCEATIYIHLSGIYRNINLAAQADESLRYAQKLIPREIAPEYTRLSILLLLEQSKANKISGIQKLGFLNKALTIFNKNRGRLHAGLGRRILYYKGMAHLKDGQLSLAEKCFLSLTGKKLLPNEVDIHTIFAQRGLGEIAFKEGKITKAENLLTKDIENKNFSPNIFLRHYDLLAQIYTLKKDIPLFAHNRELYIAKLNSLSQLEQSARVLAISFYESSKQKEITDNKDAFNRRFFIMIFGFTAVLSGIFAYYLILKKRHKDQRLFLHNKKLLEDTIESMKSQHAEENTAVPFAISEKAEHAILDKLAAFEKSELFTDQELSLKSLAKHLDTNTKYLSEIINTQKNKNFKTYINELRINYIINKLQLNPEYRQYKTSHLANEAGFTSRSSFTIVFKLVTGFSPSVFIASLEDKPQ